MRFFKLTAFIVSLLFVLGNAYAERVIVTYDSNGDELKKGQQVKVQGKNWFAVELDEHGKSAMRAKKGFKSMEVDAKRFPLSIYNDDLGNPATQQITPYGVYQSQADQLTLQPGQKVCIIDSGLDNSNTDFNWANITGDNNSGTGNWFEHGGPHGTHVAGTVAASDNGYGVVGMAPGVPLHIIKVFNDSGWGYSSDLAHAADLCTQASANIISMSLGGGRANSTEENAFNTFQASGGLVIASAGNDGDNTRKYPAGYSSVMMIGANDADNNIADFSQFPPITQRIRGQTTSDETIGVEVSAGGVNTLSTFPAGLATVPSLTADGVAYASAAMENTGTVSANTYFMGTAEATDTGASGKVCIIDRGVITFHDKVLNCENSGGVGAVIVNNVSEEGILYGTLGDTNTTSIPALGVALEDRTALLAAATTASVSVESGDYDYLSGTSMAAPTVSGVAALVWSNHPNCSGEDIRNALKATAEDQGGPGRDDYFGYGIVKAADASDYLATQSCDGLPTSENDIPTASFITDCTLLDCNFDATASTDVDGSITSYNWSFGDDNTASGINPSHSYSANGSYPVTLTVTDDKGASHSASEIITVSDGQPTPDIILTGTRSGNGRSITLNWSGITGTNVDVYVNGNLNNTTANDGSITYMVNKKGTYTFKVCEQGSTIACSNDITL